MSTPTAGGARAGLILAAVLWSTGSLFMRLLREPLGLGLHEPSLSPLQIAFFRGLFGGLFLLLLVRRADVRFRTPMLGMVLAFSVMSGMYLSALDGPAANAIFLQNTAPVWVYVFAVAVLGEKGDRRGWLSVFLAGTGAAVIVAGNWPRNMPEDARDGQTVQLLLGLGSGVMYAVVVLFLRFLRDQSSAWLVALNLLGTAFTLGLFVLLTDGWSGFVGWVTAPSWKQVTVLAVFGAAQMALPYWLFARSLRAVSAHEAALITLIEPLLNPVWAYLLTPDKDTPTVWMYVGGSLILAALVWKYLPTSTAEITGETAETGEKRQDSVGG
jgi:drug/metabolite transporter (DMT)-like permease